MVLTGPLIRRRLALSMALFFALFLILTARLFDLTVLQSRALQRRAQAQWTSESVVSPTRGAITDRKGQVLAMSATAYTASVSPRQVADPEAFARVLAPVLEMDRETIIRRASDTSRGGVTLKRQLSRETAQQLKSMLAEARAAGARDLDGLYLEEDSRRYYPLGAFACQLLGLTSIDGTGQSGLEQALDKYLSGRSGRVLKQIDGKGRQLDYSASEYIPAVDGGSVALTIDASIQSFAEQAAREALSVNNARAVRVLVMDPMTGEILAMVSKPDFDLNDPPRDDVETLTALMRNRVLTDAYEPGSTFKMLTASAALDAGLTNPSEGFYCSGSVYVDGGRIKCWGNPHGAESMAQALQNSCNPVFVELGLRLGAERYYSYLDAFGIGRATGVDIPGEASGIRIPQSRVKRVDMARIGFGQSIAVTPLQLLTAACAVVNGGRLLVPHVVKEIRSADGERLIEAQVVERGRPISEATSKTMRALLEDVVTLGGGRNAYLEGYRVGGKTGTAQVYVNGVVSSATHIGSFLGFAPMDDPRLGVLLIVDEADVPVDYGSVTAAPFARDILEKSLKYLGVAPVRTEAPLPSRAVPDVAGQPVGAAMENLKAAGFKGVLDGSGARVMMQMPQPGAEMPEGSLVMLYVDGRPDPLDGERVTVPDVTGLSILEASRLLASYGLGMEIGGSGIAVEQSPAPDSQVPPTSRVAVTFAPPG